MVSWGEAVANAVSDEAQHAYRRAVGQINELNSLVQDFVRIVRSSGKWPTQAKSDYDNIQVPTSLKTRHSDERNLYIHPEGMWSASDFLTGNTRNPEQVFIRRADGTVEIGFLNKTMLDTVSIGTFGHFAKQLIAQWIGCHASWWYICGTTIFLCPTARPRSHPLNDHTNCLQWFESTDHVVRNLFASIDMAAELYAGYHRIHALRPAFDRLYPIMNREIEVARASCRERQYLDSNQVYQAPRTLSCSRHVGSHPGRILHRLRLAKPPTSNR
jgi:hypothetical protein